MIHETVQACRAYYATGVARQMTVRLNALKRLHIALREKEADLVRALEQELGKPSFEAFMTEFATVYREIEYVTAHLEEWAKPETVPRSIDTMMARTEIIREPLGVVLIIVPTNYPVQLALMPLISAISAGNTAVIRMSGSLPNVSSELRDLIRRVFRPGHVELIDGTQDPHNELLQQRFDKILFTGSTQTATKIMSVAARTLTPVLLELGGKNPAIVLRDADVVAAARKIAWGKFVNAGQTCVAPDHVYVHREVVAAFLEELKRAIDEFYGDDPALGPHYSRIGNQRHFDRLCQLLTADLNLVKGGRILAEERYIAPTVATDVPLDHPLLRDEIFGPILPVLEYRDINSVIEQIRAKEKPLAAYVFGQKEAFARKVLLRLPSGGGCVNDTLLQVSAQGAPFGGVGHSGMGSYHGRYGFEAFSHQRTVVTSPANLMNSMLYPPYESWKEKLLRRVLTKKLK